MRLIDLSVPIVNELPVEPPNHLAKIDYINHTDSIPEMLAFFPGLGADALPEGYGWAVENFSALTSHSGTHLDAPYHYHPTMNGGEPAWKIDEIPLEWCIGDGVVLDLSDKEDGYVCTIADMEEALARIRYRLKPKDIVLIHTNAMTRWGMPAYLGAGCGIGREATLWLCDQGIRVAGTNAWSWDAPLGSIAKKYAETKDPSLIWEGHKAGREKAYCHYEKLTNLEQLPSHDFTFIGFPVKIQGAGAGWVRAVAMVN
jgi:kynurenine formamidase